ncbi:MAG: hypothetical protein ABJA98_06015 [Acidobacteriota bacterium]
MLMIQLTRSGAHISVDAEAVARLKALFAREHCIHLSRLIDADLLQIVQRRIDDSEFLPFVHVRSIGHDSDLADEFTLHILHFVANDPRFLELVREVTACREIDAFHGRVYRLDPALCPVDSWHDDMADNRVVGMSLNLSREVFAGGALQIRDRPSGRIVHEVTNTGLGAAIIFRLGHHLEHRNTTITGTIPKTAFAGWFRSNLPDYHSLVRQRGPELR